MDTEIRDPRGFTALLKAGLQGREECVSALIMHGRFMPHKTSYKHRSNISIVSAHRQYNNSEAVRTDIYIGAAPWYVSNQEKTKCDNSCVQVMCPGKHTSKTINAECM